MHRVKEMSSERATGTERQEFDKKSCAKIFEALGLRMTEKDIKFCRRVGEKGEESRPLITGFYTEMERSILLRNARYLEDTDYSDVTVGPDLTRKQREEENELRREVERKNEELTEEDKSKNLQWALVGGKGEKRLIKTVRKEWTRGRRASRGTGGERGGRARQEQRTNTARTTGEGRGEVQGRGEVRGEKEKRTAEGRRRQESRETSEESEVEMVEENNGARKRGGRNEKRKERSPIDRSPPGKR
jgi:hypothetical protein